MVHLVGRGGVIQYSYLTCAQMEICQKCNRDIMALKSVELQLVLIFQNWLLVSKTGHN